MTLAREEKTYQQALVEGSSAVGLVIILYDRLVSDLQSAIAAIGAGDIEKRSAELKHAFLVLQQLEGSLDTEQGSEMASNLVRFYSHVRGKLMEAHFKVSADMLRRQIELIMDVRQAWQEVDSQNQQAAHPVTAVLTPQITTEDREAFSCSA